MCGFCHILRFLSSWRRGFQAGVQDQEPAEEELFGPGGGLQGLQHILLPTAKDIPLLMAQPVLAEPGLQGQVPAFLRALQGPGQAAGALPLAQEPAVAPLPPGPCQGQGGRAAEDGQGQKAQNPPELAGDYQVKAGLLLLRLPGLPG